MTTNQELRKQAEKAADAYERSGRGDVQFTGAQVIELLDRIDRLEAENEKLDQLSDQYMDKVDKLLAENEAQRKLLERARDALDEQREVDLMLTGAYRVRDAITDHLKGKNHG